MYWKVTLSTFLIGAAAITIGVKWYRRQHPRNGLDDRIEWRKSASAGGVISAAPRIETPTGRLTDAVELAVLKALSDGVDQIVAATVYAEEGEVSVCGACRQLLADYGSDGITVRGVVGEEQVFEAAIGDLLPDEL